VFTERQIGRTSAGIAKDISYRAISQRVGWIFSNQLAVKQNIHNGIDGTWSQSEITTPSVLFNDALLSRSVIPELLHIVGAVRLNKMPHGRDRSFLPFEQVEDDPTTNVVRLTDTVPLSALASLNASSSMSPIRVISTSVIDRATSRPVEEECAWYDTRTQKVTEYSGKHLTRWKDFGGLLMPTEILWPSPDNPPTMAGRREPYTKLHLLLREPPEFELYRPGEKRAHWEGAAGGASADEKLGNPLFPFQ
jgi:hypothetical protein